MLQRKAADSNRASEIPPIVHDVLRSPGRPLDPANRIFMESRFGNDFSGVRLHTDSRAAESARAMDALAYTVGENVVFGARQYRPETPDGRRLLAHELAHVTQQRASAPTPMARLRVDSASSPAEVEADRLAETVMNGASVPRAALSSSAIQRACLPAAQCGTIEGSLETFVAETQAKPENKSKKEKRKDLCKAPPDPKCTADKHGDRAPNLTALLKERLPERFGFIEGIFIDKDIPAQYGAYTDLCTNFVPPRPFPGKTCTFVPESLEKEAGAFNTSKSPTIGGHSRLDWMTLTLRILTHETEHARFDAAPAIAKPSAGACEFSAVSLNLTEMAAITSEFKVVHKRLRAKPEKKRQPELDIWFDFWIKRGRESISGNVKGMRCACECNDADEYIRKTISGVTAGWDSYELHTFHSELRKPKWKLNWPIAPPAAIKIEDLPSPGIEVDVRDLPNK